MSRQIICSNTTSGHRRKPLLQTLSSSNSSSTSSIGGGGSGSSGSPKNSAMFGEFCGGTTAECAAICCCCPCSIANLLVLVFYKLPAGICRRALRLKLRRKLKKKELLQTKNHQRGHRGFDNNNNNSELKICLEDIFPDVKASEETEKAVVELEKEMWQRFYGTGFWRSPSQRELESPKIKQTIGVLINPQTRQHVVKDSLVHETSS